GHWGDAFLPGVWRGGSSTVGARFRVTSRKPVRGVRAGRSAVGRRQLHRRAAVPGGPPSCALPAEPSPLPRAQGQGPGPCCGRLGAPSYPDESREEQVIPRLGGPLLRRSSPPAGMRPSRAKRAGASESLEHRTLAQVLSLATRARQVLLGLLSR